MSSWESTLLRGIYATNLLRREEFKTEDLEILRRTCVSSRDTLLERIGLVLAQFFGVLSANTVQRYIGHSDLRKRFIARIACWQEIYTGLKEGKELREIGLLPTMQTKLKSFSIFSSLTAEDIIRREIVLCLYALPMPVVETQFFKSKCVLPAYITGLEERTLILSKRLYDYLGGRDWLTISEQHMDELESFCHRGWGILNGEYVSWLSFILGWNTRSSMKEKLLTRFKFSLDPINGIENEKTPGEFRQYSVLKTIEIFEKRVRVKLPASIVKILSQELYGNELLRQEMFLCPQTGPTHYGSTVVNEILECVNLATRLCPEIASQDCVVLESIYFADATTRETLAKSNASIRFDLVKEVQDLQTFSREILLKILLLLQDHPHPQEAVSFAAAMFKQKYIFHLDAFLLTLLENRIPIQDYRSYEEIFMFLQKEIGNLCPLTTPPDDTLFFEVAYSIKTEGKKEKVSEFVSLFRGPDLVPMPGNTVYRALHRFIQGEYSHKTVKELDDLDCFLLTARDKIEFFSHPLPPIPQTLDPTVGIECNQRARGLRNKYRFTEPETFRLFLQFVSRDLEMLRNFTRTIYDVEELVKSPLSKELAYHLFYSFPPLNGLEEADNPLVKRLAHVLRDKTQPDPQPWIPFLSIDSIEDERLHLSSPSPQLNTLFLVNADLPFGPVMLCQWIVPSDVQKAPLFQLVVLNPLHLAGRMCQFSLNIPVITLRENKQLRSALSQMSDSVDDPCALFVKDIETAYRSYRLLEPDDTKKIIDHEVVVYPLTLHRAALAKENSAALSDDLLTKIPELATLLKAKKHISLCNLKIEFCVQKFTPIRYPIFWSYNPDNRHEVTLQTLIGRVQWSYGEFIDHPFLENLLQLQLLFLLNSAYT